jgi:glycosyltransferase involved in cell wall biosynthesis
MKILFIGFALPDAEFARVVARDAGMPVQTQRFGWSVVEALKAAGADVALVSAAPVTDYPSNSQLVFRGRRFAANGTHGTTVPFLNITGIKHLTRFVSSSVAVRRLTRRAGVEGIVVHGVHSPFIWVAVRAARRRGVPAVVVLTDPPSFTTPYDGRVSEWLKRFDRHLILAGLARADGVVALTEDLAHDFAAGKPWLQFEGIARPLAQQPTSHESGSGAEAVVYAGALEAEYGVRRLIEAVGASRGSWTLHVYGAGSMAEEVRTAAAEQERVVFHGLADTETLASAYGGAALLVNPRPIDQPFVRYSFPSKLLEYLSTGRPVMTTRLPTIPADYDAHLIYTGDTSREMADTVDAFFRSGRSDAVSGEGRDFVLATRGVEAQGVRLREFLTRLAEGPA